MPIGDAECVKLTHAFEKEMYIRYFKALGNQRLKLGTEIRAV